MLKKVIMSDLGEIYTGNTPSKKNNEYYESNDIMFIKPDIMSFDIENIAESNEYISEKARDKARIVPANSLLVSCIGNIGKLAINKEEASFNQQINAIVHNENIVSSKYLAYLLKYNQKRLEAIANAPVVPIINKTQFSNFEVSIHERLETQKKIAEVLDKAQELIDKRKEQIKAMDELVKSRFIEMFGDINDYVSVSEYIESLTAGKSLAGESECLNKVLNTGSVSYDYYDETQVKNLPLDYLPKKEHLVNDGDVLISRMNTAELVGATAYVWKSKENIYIPDRLWKANLKPNVNPIFVWQLLIQRSTKEQIRKIASGTSGSMKNISKSGLLGLEVINVDINKQNEFADFVKQVDKLKSEMETSLKELEDNFKSLMQRAFRGQLF